MRVPRRLAGVGASDLPDAAAFDAYIGPAREITLDPVRKLLRVHDGVTPGGVNPEIIDNGVPTRAALAMLDTAKTTSVSLSEAGREGFFTWRLGDFSEHIAVDTAQGIYIKADDISADLGAWVRVFDGPIWANWFGFLPSAEPYVNAAAMNAALSMIVLLDTRLMIGAGEHKLNAKITKDFADNAVSICGLGENVTILEWINADGGFDFTITNIPGMVQQTRVFEFRHMSLHTAAAGGGTAFKGTVSPILASCVSKMFDIQSVSVRGSDVASDYWTNGIHLVDVWNSHVTRCTVKGLDDATSPFDALTGIRIDRGNDCHVLCNHIYHVMNGIYLFTTVPSYGDGTMIGNNRIVGVDYGIYLDSTVIHAPMGINDNHINAYIAGIVCNNVCYAPISKNLIFKTHVSNTDQWCGIKMTGANSNFNAITDNQVATPGSPGGLTNYGIYLDSADGNLVSGNQFHDTTGTFVCIILTNTARHNQITENKGSDTVTLPVVALSGTQGAPNFIKYNNPSQFQSFASGDSSPSVGNLFDGWGKTNNNTATSIVTLDDLEIGQVVTIQIDDNMTSWIHNNTALFLKGAANIAAPTGAGGWISFTKRNDGRVQELFRSF